MPNTDPVTVPIRGKDELTPALKSAQGGLSGFANSIKGAASGLQDLRAGFAFLGDGLRMLEVAYTATVGATLNYADTVRQLSRLSGQSAEETSRLIQLTDDLGVETSDLEAAMSAAARKGIAFTTESIAKLADKYVALQSPVERNTLLIDNFGRSGLNMAAAMAQGGDAIRNMSSAVDANLILTQKQIDQAREHQILIDNIKDSWQGYMIQMGTATIPTLNNYVIAQTNLNEKTKEFGGFLLNWAPIRTAATLLEMQHLEVLQREKEWQDKVKQSVNDTTTAQANLSRTMSLKERNPSQYGNVYQSHNAGYQTNSTLTVKNEATLNVKLNATGALQSAQSDWVQLIWKAVRDMQSAGIIPKATR